MGLVFKRVQYATAILLGLLVFASISLNAAADGEIQWARQFGSVEHDRARGVANYATDAYVAGWAAEALLGQQHIGGQDAFVSKYDRDGTLLWTRQFGTTLDDVGYGVAASSSGTFVAGDTKGSLGSDSNGNQDAFVRMYSPSGQHQWTRQWGTAWTESARGVAADDSGVYVVGFEFGAAPGLPLVDQNAFIRKYDGSGNLLWAHAFGANGDPGAFDIAYGVTVQGASVYVVGSTWGVFPGQVNEGVADIFLRKYDTNGNYQWTTQLGSSFSDYGYATAADISGVYIAGATLGTLPSQTSLGQNDAFVMKYDHNGVLLWIDQFGTSTSDQANGVAADGDNPLVVGQTNGMLPGETKVGGTDAFIRKYDADGNVLWTVQYGTTAWDSAFGVSLPMMYVAGATGGTRPGQTSAGLDDAFLDRWGEEFLCDPAWLFCPN